MLSMRRDRSGGEDGVACWERGHHTYVLAEIPKLIVLGSNLLFAVHGLVVRWL